MKSKLLRRSKNFSRAQLIAFALVFASLGGYVIYRTFANQPVAGLLHPNGTLIELIKDKESSLYLIEDGRRRPVSLEAFQTSNYVQEDVRRGTEADAELPAGEPLPLAEGAVVKEGNKTYQLEKDGGHLKKRLIENSQILSQMNTGQADLTELGKSKLPRSELAPVKNVDANSRHPNGTVILSGKKTYLIDNNQRRPVNSKAIAQSYQLDRKSTAMESEGDRELPLGPALKLKSGAVVKGTHDTKYVIENKTVSRFRGLTTKETFVKRPIRSQEAFLSYSYRDSEVITMPDSEIAAIPTGKPLPESTSAPVEIMVTPQENVSVKQLSDELVGQGGKLRITSKEWFSVEVPLEVSEGLKSNPRVKKVEGNVQNLAYLSIDGYRIPQCEDGQDNDGDGKTDYPVDPGCVDGSDDSEYNSASPAPAPAPAPPPPPAPTPPPAGQPPVNQTDPTVGGLPRVGETLVGGTGQWGNGVSYFSFKWQRCTNDQPEGYGSGCIDISNGNTQNYLLVEADRSFRIRLVVTASNQYGPGLAAGSKVTQQVSSGAAPAPAPAPAPPPSPSPSAPRINVWKFYGGNSWVYSVDQASRCEVRIQGGGIQPFTPSLGGEYTVTAGNGNVAGQLWCWNGNEGPTTSNWAGPTSPNPPPPPPPGKPAPTISLWKFNSGNSWSYSVTNASYCEVYVSGGGIQPFTPSNGGLYSVTAGNGNQAGQLKCWNGGVGPTVSAFEGPYNYYAPPPPPRNPQPAPDQIPVITGQPQVGQTLFATSGTWKNGVNSFMYQWYRCSGIDSLGYGVNCNAILYAVNSNYNLVSDDQGSLIVVKVTARNSYGLASAASLATSVITNAPINGVAELASEPASPVATGASVTLKWYMQYGSNCIASATPANPNWQGSRPPNGSQLIGRVNVTTKFNMSCFFQTKRVTIALEVVVIKSGVTPPEQPPEQPVPGRLLPFVELSSDQGNSVASGTPVRLRWQGSNVDTCSGTSSPNNPVWNGAGKAGSGNQLVGPLTASTTFTIKCTNSATGASDDDTVIVSVRGPAPPTPFELMSPHLARVGATPTSGSSAGSIAVIDSGVNPSSTLRVTEGANCTGDGTSSAVDSGVHGTQVATIIGGSGDGISAPNRGIAPGTNIVSFKVVSSGTSTKSDVIACAFEAAANAGLPINASFSGLWSGGCGEPDSFIRRICTAISKTRVVAAAGNDATDAGQYFPANLPGVIVVSAIIDTNGRPPVSGQANVCGQDDNVSCISNFGSGSFNNTIIAAPSPGGGTSFAAPMVAGGGTKTDSSPEYTYLSAPQGRNYGPLMRL